MHPVGPPRSGQAPGFVAGVIGAGLALAFGELAEGLSTTQPSAVVAVGELIIDYTPGDVVAASISNLGTNQKWMLLAGTTLATLLAGGLLGRVAAGGRRVAAASGFAVLGLVGGWAMARNPFSSTAMSALVAVVAAGIATATTLFLSSRGLSPASRALSPASRTLSPASRTLSPAASRAPADPAPDALEVPLSPAILPSAPGRSRRAFLVYVGGASVVAGALVGLGRWARGPSLAERARAVINLPRPTVAPAGTTPTASVDSVTPSTADVFEQVAELDTLNGAVPGISTYLTPNGSFYRIDTALIVPQVDPETWSLSFTGMVNNAYRLTFDDILAMDLSDHVITLSCVSNQVGGDLVGNAVWTGVPLTVLLERAGVQPGATQIVGRSVDGWTAGFPSSVIADGRNAVLAVGMNGEPLPVDHGFPARLVVAGLYGYVSAVKWLSEIHLTTWDGFDGYWVPRGWAKEGPMKTQSRIDVPRSSDRLVAGEPTPVAGIAWAPTRAISAVEVRIDGGEWLACVLGEALGEESWVQWHHPWTPSAGRHTIEVRAIDGTGAVQSPGPVPPRPDGAEGWHSVAVTVQV